MHISTAPNQNGSAAKSSAAPAADVWTAAAPAKLRSLHERGKSAALWRAWLDHLATRTQPIRAVPRRCDLLLGWTEATLPSFGELTRLQRLLGGKVPGRQKLLRASRLEDWLAGPAVGEGMAAAYRTLLWARVLPQLAARLPAPTWWRLLERLVDEVGRTPSDWSDARLGQQVWGVELPLWLALGLPEIAGCGQQLAAVYEALDASLDGLLEGGEIPPRQLAADWWPLVASWTRSCALLAQDQRQASQAPARFRAAVLDWLRRARGDGVAPAGRDSLQLAARVARCKDAFRAAVCGRRKATARLARQMRRLAQQFAEPPARGGKHRAAGDRPAHAAPPSDDKVWPSRHDAAARKAVLRTDWSRGAPLVVVDYGGPDVSLELSVGRDVLLTGPWQWQLAVAEQPLAAVGGWRLECWLTDAQVDYLEVAIDLAGGQVLQRQIVLARRESQLLLVDAVVGEGAGPLTACEKIGTGTSRPRASAENLACTLGASPIFSQALSYESWLPLAEGAIWSSAEETSEGVLSARKPRAVALPLSLPEWRSERREGQLACEGRTLHWRQLAAGPRLCAALLVDLARERLGQPLTWRRLTVAHARHIEPPHQAVGFRAQLGRRQWLVYRSLAPAPPRSVLGQHLASDFVWARFRRSGQIDPVVEITA